MAFTVKSLESEYSLAFMSHFAFKYVNRLSLYTYLFK